MKMSMANIGIGLACGLAGLSGVAIGLLFFGESEVLRSIQALGSLAIACSAVVAYRLYRANTARHVQEDKRDHSGVFLEEAKKILDRAYEIFAGSGGLAPANDRVLWLSVARMLLRYQSLMEYVTEPDHIQILEENEEFQRLRFYQLMERAKDELDTEYFQGPEDQRQAGAEIDDRSIAVIFHFTKWPGDRPDPIAEINDIELFAQGVVPIDFLGVEGHLGRRQEHWEAIQARKQQLRDTRT